MTYVNIAATITCMNEGMRKKIEPGGAPSLNRFAVLKAFAKTNAVTGLHFMPIIPYLIDSFENIDALYYNASLCQVDYVLPGLLYLRGKTKKVFWDFIKQDFNHLYEPLQALYKTGSVSKEYKEKLYISVNKIKNHYGLSGNYIKPQKEKLKQLSAEQLTLFK